MGKIGEFLSGMKVLEEVESKFNGKLTVVKSIGYGTYIKAGGLTQSGGIVTSIWKRVLRKVSRSKNLVPSVLVLGLGGGGIVPVIKEFWPEAKITGVDIDLWMIKLGKKYLELAESETKIEIGDALKSVQSKIKSKFKYDLVLVDLYNGDKYPEKFGKEDFLRLVLRLLTIDGIAVFNRLYYGEKRKESVAFGNLLEKEFTTVEWFYPEANLMFICTK